MPPFVGRKRSPPPNHGAHVKRVKVDNKRDRSTPASLKEAQVFSLGSDSDSSLSEVDSEEFEDVVKLSKTGTAHKPARLAHDDDGSDHEETEFEDVVPATKLASADHDRELVDVKLNIAKDHEVIDYSAVRRDGKKGPNRREKAARIRTHQVHVQFLLWHNAIRNSWIGDRKLQDTLVKQLPSQIVREVEKWKRASGLAPPETMNASPRDKRHSKKKRKNNHRDWGQPSQRLEDGKPDMSHGDPIISLLKVLSAYWKRRFAVTAPGLRKRGYGSKIALKQDISSYRNDKYHAAKHGERIRNLDEFRELARRCEGSRDVGAQLFTALLRAIGIEARLVASLQPAGYGWTKAEEMVPRKVSNVASDPESDEVEIQNSESGEATIATKTNGKASTQVTVRDVAMKRRPVKKSGDMDTPIQLDSDVKLESTSSDGGDGDDDSVIDTTPSMPAARPAKYDRDLAFPIYWAEVVSPITSKVIPVSPLVLENPVATSPEIVSTFEPRGAKADKARQVMAYVVAYSPDGSAKDVTIRYLRRKLWPGKTKGVRFPIEKVPIYNDRGKIVDYDEYDWFAHCMQGYGRPDDKRQKVDELEDVELVPAEPDRKSEEGDTLQSLKSSSEWVLERHLRREEALRPDAKPDRMFMSGKGDKQMEEPVYSRKDVERCLTTESWHKEGRIPREGEMPMKFVPVRAVTLTRKREAEEHKQRTGETQMQGLYSIHQTEYIIPPPIQDGKIPKNSYGNIDCFVDSMIPRGAVHVPLKGTPRLCKRLEIDFAEAVVGFEFGNKMAVPVIQGVVIAAENEQMLREAWDEWNVEQKRKEDEKVQRQVLELWRKFAIGLRIRQRVSDTYDVNLDAGRANSGARKEDAIDVDEQDNMAGGFTNTVEEQAEDEDMGGGFLVHEREHIGDDLVMEEMDASQQQQQQQHRPRPSRRDTKSKPIEPGTANGDADETLANEKSKNDSQPQSAIRRRGQTSTSCAQRKTPARRARAKSAIIDSPDSISNSDSDLNPDSDADRTEREYVSINKTGGNRHRRRKIAGDVRNVRGHGSGPMREESTFVGSPYFDGSSQ